MLRDRIAKGSRHEYFPGYGRCKGREERGDVCHADRFEKRFSVVEVELVTGRTHQIRVHLSHEGHPLVGDIKYGDRRVNGMAKNKLGITTQLLHAYQLKFSGLEGNFAYLNGKTVKAKLPEEFQEALQKLGFTDKDLEAFA